MKPRKISHHPVYGKYAASITGKVYSYQTGKRKKLKLCLTPLGYLKFNLYTGEKILTMKVHRFVWECFFGLIPAGKIMNHKNFKPRDNRLQNLEICDHKWNTHYSAFFGRFSKKKNQGEKNIKAKLSVEQVKLIREKLKAGEEVRQIAKEYNMGMTAIYYIKSGKNWGHLWGK